VAAWHKTKRQNATEACECLSCILPLWRVVLAAATLVALAAQGASPDKLSEIPQRVQQFVDNKTISGAVTLVAQRGQIASLESVGLADIAQHLPMRRDTLFWIASMTKPITAAAILMLQDEGKLSVEDPVDKYLAEFQNQWIIEARSNTSLTLKRPPRSITIRDLLTHTSGIGDVAAPRPDCSLAELVAAYSQQPLQFPPGSRWSYSNAGINTLGRLVEVVSGQPYAEFVEAHVLQPLEMRDTTFWPSEAALDRLAKSYQPHGNGSELEPTEIYFIKGKLSDHKRTAFPAGGLFSTAEDYWHFCQMCLNGGSWRGKQLLSEDAVNAMTHTQTGDLVTGFTEGMSYGFGFAVVKQPGGVTAMLSPGTFGHGGAYGTQAWTDPSKGVVLVLMIQRAKLPNADASDVRRVFQQTAIDALSVHDVP
jgi:CubicO group peptidase (beta-lactamase class C family)